MDLIDRYVVEVARYLPEKTAGDIATELHSSLGDALDAREAAAGRPADQAMVVALLREFGHPEAVADRYREPRALIGAAWYPSYRYIATTVVVVLTVLRFGGLAVRAFISPRGLGWDAFGAALGNYVEAVFVGVAITTFLFAGLERLLGAESGEEGHGAWEPLDLPAIDGPDAGLAVDRRAVESGIWGNAIMLAFLWAFPQWLGIPWGRQYHYAVVSLADLGFGLPTALLTAYWVGALLLDALLLRHQRWTEALRRAELGLGLVAAAALVVMLATAGSPRLDEAWFAARGWPIDTPALLNAGTTMHRIVSVILTALLARQVWQTVRRVRRLLGEGGPRVVSAAGRRRA